LFEIMFNNPVRIICIKSIYKNTRWGTGGITRTPGIFEYQPR
jgi:hypothetical protein